MSGSGDPALHACLGLTRALSRAVCWGWDMELRVSGSQTGLGSLRVRAKARTCRVVLIRGRTSPPSRSPGGLWGVPQFLDQVLPTS